MDTPDDSVRPRTESSNMSTIVGCSTRTKIAFALLSTAWIGLAPFCAAEAQQYVASRPTADEVRWHREFVRLYDAGRMGEAAAAAENLERSLQGTKDAQGWYILGNDYNAVRRWQAAIGAINQSLALLPDNAPAINSLGVSYQGLGRNDLALQLYRRSAALGNDVALRNANELLQSRARATPAPGTSPNDLADRVRAAQELEHLRRCGTYSC